MFLKVSDTQCRSTKGLTKVELNSDNTAILLHYENNVEVVNLECPYYRGSSSEYANFARDVYAKCYLAIIMCELSNKSNIATSFDYILADNELLLNASDFEKKYQETKSDYTDNTSDEDELLRIMCSDLVDDLMDDFKDTYL